MGFVETLGRGGFNPGRAIQQGFAIRSALDDRKKQKLKAEKLAEKKRKREELIDVKLQGLNEAQLAIVRPLLGDSVDENDQIPAGIFADKLDKAAQNRDTVLKILQPKINEVQGKLVAAERLFAEKDATLTLTPEKRSLMSENIDLLKRELSQLGASRSKFQQKTDQEGLGRLREEKKTNLGFRALNRTDDANLPTSDTPVNIDRDAISQAQEASGNLKGAITRRRQQETDATALAKEGRAAGKTTQIKTSIKQVIRDGKPVTGLFNAQTGEFIADLGKPIPNGLRIKQDADGNLTVEQGNLTPDKLTNRKQLDTIQAIDTVVAGFDDLEGILKDENVGISGKFRQGIFGLRQQSKAFDDFFQKTQREVQSDATGNFKKPNKSKFNPGSKLFDVNKLFDPNLDEQEALSNILAYRLARSLDPSGRLSDADVDNARKVIGLDKLLTGTGSIKARFGAIRRQLSRERSASEKRIGKKIENFVSVPRENITQTQNVNTDFSQKTDEEILRELNK